jgi:hypothetical protein
MLPPGMTLIQCYYDNLWTFSPIEVVLRRAGLEPAQVFQTRYLPVLTLISGSGSAKLKMRELFVCGS